MFLGTAVVVSPARIDKSDESAKLFLTPGTYRVDIRDIQIWERSKPIRPLLKKLSFIKNEEHWGPYLQGGVRKISEGDYKVIIESEDFDAGPVSEKTVSETILAFNQDAAAYSPHTLKSPERVKIDRIVENVQKGWQIPNFQRYFDWNKEDVRSFLESVFNDYYVGSFLLWESSADPSLAVQPIKGVGVSESKVDYIILDGQQRMTALYYAIKAPDFGLKGSVTKRCYYFLDLRAFIEDGSREDVVVVGDKKISREDSYRELLFPYYELENLHSWVDGFEDYLDTQTHGEPMAPSQVKSVRRTIEKRLGHVWSGFEIPYVTLPATMELTRVADIFEKINSKGKPLNTFDLLIARLLKYDVKLKDLWDKACEEYPNIKRYDESTEKTRMAVFQIMSLLYHPASSTKRKDILNVFENLSISDKAQFESYWKICIESLNKAVARLENMRDGFGVRSEKDVPFMPALPMLAAFIAKIEDSTNKPILHKKVEEWYWSASVMGAYSSSAESQMASDFKEVTRWFDEDSAIPSVVVQARNDLGGVNLMGVDEQSSILYKTVLSLIALAGAKDFATGQTLENARENQKDHIFPRSPTVGFGGHENVDSVLNMTWMSSDTNMLVKRAKKPSEYVPLFISEKFDNNEKSFADCLGSHLIDDVCLSSMKEDKIDEFLIARQLILKKEFRKKIGGGSEIEAKIEDDPNAVIDEVEEKIRVLIDETLTSKNSDYWSTLIPQGVREHVAEKITHHNGRHPGDVNMERDGYEKLCFCDIMDYLDIIILKTNWADFEGRFGKKSQVEKHFGNIAEYRNCIKHSRSANNVVKKQGEASLEWIYSVLRA